MILFCSTQQIFAQIVKDWLDTAKHPKTGRLYTDMVFQPMLELLAYSRSTKGKTTAK
jgi:hypothetical protein